MPIKVSITDEFDETQLEVGHILWYEIEEVNDGEPHPHVIVAIDCGYIYTVCGTSQQETVERKAKNLGHDGLTYFPAIEPNKNSLSKTTFFDCCDYFSVHQSDLMDKYQDGQLVKQTGSVTYTQYDEIRQILKSNSTIDIKDILNHPEDNK